MKNVSTSSRAAAILVAIVTSSTASAAILSPADTTVTQDGQTVVSQDVYTPWDVIDIVTTGSASCAIFDGEDRQVATVYPKLSGSSYRTTYAIKSTDRAGQWRMNCGGSVADFVVDDVHEQLWLQDGGFDAVVRDYVAAGGPKSTWWKGAPAIGSAPTSWVTSSAWYYELDVVLPTYSWAFARKIPRRNGTFVGGSTAEPWEQLYNGGGLAMSTALQRLALSASTFDRYATHATAPADPAEANADEYEKALVYWADYLVSVPDWSNPKLPNVYKDSNGRFVYCGTGSCYTKDGAGNKVAFSGTKTQATTYFDDLERGQLLIGLAAAYDWMHDRLSPAKRRAWRDKLIRESIRYRVDEGLPRPWSTYDSSRLGNLLTNSHIYYHHAGPAIVAMVLHEEMAPTASRRDQWIRDADVMFDKAFVELGGDGADHQGVGYWEFTLDVMLRFVEAQRTILNDASAYRSLWLTNTPKFLQYMTYPNGQRVNFGDSEYSDRSTMTGLLARIASQNRSALSQRIAWKGHNRWSYPDGSVRRDVLEILWWDETLQPLAKEEWINRNRCFWDKGLASVRTGWDADATMLAYRGGGIVGSHDDPDVGSFVIYDQGHLVTSDGLNLISKRTAVHSTFLVDGKGQHGDGLDMLTFPPTSSSGNDNGRMTTYLDNSAIKPESSEAPDVVTMGSDLTQMYRYDSTDTTYHHSTNVEVSGKKLYELTRYLVWLGADATLVLDRWRGNAPFRMDWNLSTGKNVDLNRDGREDSANPDTCPVRKGTRYGWGLYRNSSGVNHDVLFKNDAANVCAGSSCTANATSLYRTNLNWYRPVMDTSFTKYRCDDNIAIHSSNGRVTIKAADSIGGRLDVVPLEPNRSSWDRQASPYLSGSSVSGFHLNRRQNAASGQFITALLPWSWEDPQEAQVRSSTVTGGSHIVAELSESEATVLFASPGQSQVRASTTSLNGVLGVVVEDPSSREPHVAQLVDGTLLVHRGRTFVSANAPVQVGLTYDPSVAYGYVKVKGQTVVKLALPDFGGAQVARVELNGKPATWRAVSGGIEVTVPSSGTLSIYGPGSTSAKVMPVSNCW